MGSVWFLVALGWWRHQREVSGERNNIRTLWYTNPETARRGLINTIINIIEREFLNEAHRFYKLFVSVGAGFYVLSQHLTL